MRKALAGIRTNIVPVGIYYLGEYLQKQLKQMYIEVYRKKLIKGKGAPYNINIKEDIEIKFEILNRAYSIFKERCDWMELSGGYPRYPENWVSRDIDIILENDNFFYLNQKTGEISKIIIGDWSLTSDLRDMYIYDKSEEFKTKVDVDKTMSTITSDKLLDSKRFDLQKKMIKKYGEKFFIYTISNSPYWEAYRQLGFNGVMFSFKNKPDILRYVIEKNLEQLIEYVKCWAKIGCESILIQEVLASADIISEEYYLEFVFPYEKRLIEAIHYSGMYAILLFYGDIKPRLDFINDLGTDGLAVEMDRKAYGIDIGQVREKLNSRICLFGNADTENIIEKGTDEDIEKEVKKQLTAVKKRNGNFVMAFGSTITPKTSPQRIDFFVRLCRKYGRNAK